MYLVIVLHSKGVPAQAPVLSFCRLETTALTMYFAPVTGALAGLPSNFGIQDPAAGSWPQLGIQGPGAGSWPHLAIQSPGAPYLPLEIRREGQLRRRDPSTDTEALEHRLRRKCRERPAAQKSPVADDATRPVPSGRTRLPVPLHTGSDTRADSFRRQPLDLQLCHGTDEDAATLILRESLIRPSKDDSEHVVSVGFFAQGGRRATSLVISQRL